MKSDQYRLGVDIGGTFTDIVLMRDDGRVFSKKLLSTPSDYSAAIGAGVGQLIEELSIEPESIVEFTHATTVATNAIIERKGVRVALVTTRGFRDVLELGRYRAPRPYDINFRKPEPLVPRQLRFELDERMAADGTVIRGIALDSLERIATALKEAEVDAVALCLINSYVNPAHETAAASYLRERLPRLSVSVSSMLLPQMGEYERTSTTVINSYVRPVVERYVDSLGQRLKELRIEAPLMIMQSSGGLAPATVVAKRPITIIESGPAAGVLGGQRLGRHVEAGDLVIFDMGGTTAKATIIDDFEFVICPETEVGGGASLGSRMIKGSGYPVLVPTIDIAEVGAGGGSIASVDAAGGFRVGPRSAGAEPGPVCYARGGQQPTVTDANLLLGYLNPDELVGGELALDKQAAARAIEQLAGRTGLGTTETAYGVHVLANATMLRALQGVSSERGQDPASFSMFAIGGNGPVHAASLAEAGNMRHVIVPPVAGLFSALGMLFADLEYQVVSSFYQRLDAVVSRELQAAFDDLVRSGRQMLSRQGFSSDSQQLIKTYADIKYLRQTSPITVPIPVFPITQDSLRALADAFEQAHLKTFGYVTRGERLQLVSLKVTCQGVASQSRLPARMQRDRERRGASRERNAYFGAAHQWMTTPVMARSDIGQAPMPGPAIVEEYDTTVVVRPGWTVRTDTWNNLHMERAEG